MITESPSIPLISAGIIIGAVGFTLWRATRNDRSPNVYEIMRIAAWGETCCVDVPPDSWACTRDRSSAH